MSFLDRIVECNRHDLSGFRPFIVAGARVGWLRHGFIERLRDLSDIFLADGDAVVLDPRLADFEARSAALEPVLRALAAEGALSGWRDEPYPVSTGFAAPALLRMERAAVPAFGVRAHGVHLNGYVRRADGGFALWVARRARDKPTYPGMLDNMVAGGLPLGIGLRENLIKECAEEAAIPRALAERAIPVGAISYVQEAPAGLKPDTQFLFDLEVPADFEPRNTDGEIESFALWPVEAVMETVAETTAFKPNCTLVIIDFLVRHGLIPPDHPDYLNIVRGLHQ